MLWGLGHNTPKISFKRSKCVTQYVPFWPINYFESEETENQPHRKISLLLPAPRMQLKHSFVEEIEMHKEKFRY